MENPSPTPAPRIPDWNSPGPLALFFTCGVSLETWRSAGILSREMALYQRLRAVFPEILLLTYGGDEDRRIAGQFGCHALPKPAGMDPFRYSFILPLVHRRELCRAAVLKTNQFDGAWSAVIARLLFGKPLVVRAGYLLSHVAERGAWSRKGRWWVRNVERWSCRLADRVIVTADAMRRRLASRYGIPSQKVLVSPNFVDLDRFRPSEQTAAVPGRIGFVGRLEPEKNLDLLLDALAVLPGAELCVVGDGSLRRECEDKAARIGLRVRFLGTLPNEELPAFYRSCEVVVVPSLYEGHPKVVLEAMACGRAVVGTDVDGIRDVIDDGRTGLLAELSAEGVARTVARLRNDPRLAEGLGRNARARAQREFSLAAAAAREIDLYRRLLGPAPATCKMVDDSPDSR